MVSFTNLKEPKNIASGISTTIYFAPVSWFAPGGIKRPVPPYNAPGDSVIIKSDFQFRSDKGFIELEMAPRKNKFESQTIGDLGLNTFLQTLQAFLPGSYANQHEQVKSMLNTPLIVLGFDCNCPEEYVYAMGCECTSVWLNADFSSGYSHDGTKGHLLNFITNSPAVFLYEGLIEKAGTLQSYLIDFDEAFVIDGDLESILTE